MMKKCSIVWHIISTSLFEYETSKVVQIKSWKIGFVYRLIQLSIILYVSLWVMYHDKGYQIFDYPVAGVTAKLKGIAFANLTNIPSIGIRVWDTADFVVPPQQNSAFFVATNMVITPNQALGECDESTDVYNVTCATKDDCVAGKLVHLGSGVSTGKCVNSSKIPDKKVCQIYGWCPTEYDKMPLPNKPLLTSAPNFTVLLKNSIEFTKFKVKRRNILKWMNKKFLYSCRYMPTDSRHKFCPIFRLQDIIDYSDATHKDIWTQGGLMSIHIEWNCDLDFDVELCVPHYTFRRLDDFNDDVGKGWNFRYSHHYVEDGIEKRTLIKVYGIQFFITVSGRGGQFNPFKFSMNLGSGLALLGIASVLCDLFVLNIVRKRELYKKARVDSLKSIMNHRGYCTNKECGNCKSNVTTPIRPKRITLGKSIKFGMKKEPKQELTMENNEPTFMNSNEDTEYYVERYLNSNFHSNSQLTSQNMDHRHRLSQSFECISNCHGSRQSSQRYSTEFLRFSKSSDLAFMDDLTDR